MTSRFLLVFDLQLFKYDMPKLWGFCIYPTWFSELFGYEIYSLINFGKFLAIVIQIFYFVLSFPSGILIRYNIRPFDIIPHLLNILFYFFVDSCFSFWILVWVISIDLPSSLLVLCLPMLNLLMSSFKAFIISITVIFSSPSCTVMLF